MNHKEDDEQKALIQWANATKQNRESIGAYLFAIPNGGKRNPKEARRLKAQGVKAGVSDLFLPLAHGGHLGLWLEMKSALGKLTDTQEDWLLKMEKQGYEIAVCYNWMQARDTIKRYLGLPQTQVINE